MNQVIELAQSLENKAKARYEQKRQKTRQDWQKVRELHSEHACFVEQLASVTEKHKAIAIKDEALIFKHGRFDPPKPGILNPGNFLDVEYNWFAKVRKAHKRMCE